MGYLDKILEEKRKEIEKKKRTKIKKRIYPILNFKKAITRSNKINLIAEIKRKSPSAGIICKNFDPVRIACEYEQVGASAISVLTDRRFFGGSNKYISKIKEKVKLPILAKDFFIDEYQIREAYLYGADAVLLIVSILEDNVICKFLKLTKKLKIDAIIEVHTEDQVKKVLKWDVDIIGINNRDLQTFKVDITMTPKLLKFIPDNKVVISESGIKHRNQVKYLANNDVDAILVGEELMRSRNIKQRIPELLYG